MFWNSDKKDEGNDKPIPPGLNFKADHLYFYANTESMINSGKNYRKVFEKKEIDYFNVEFTFHNKKFDEEDWTCTIVLVCTATDSEGRKGKEYFRQETKDFAVAKDKPLIVHRKSWGMDEKGAYWMPGNYICEAFIDGNLATSATYIIYDYGLVTATSNPYFSFNGLRFYPAYDDFRERTEGYRYVTQFSRSVTEYLGVELDITLNINDSWFYEFFIAIYDDSGAPKALFTKEGTFKAGEKGVAYYVRESWGNKEKSVYKPGKYSVVVYFMEQFVAGGTVSFGDEEILGTPEIQKSFQLAAVTPADAAGNTVAPKKSLDELLADMDMLVGMADIKTSIRSFIDYLKFNKMRMAQGFKDDSQSNIHSVFTGNPGTGKTTIVHLLGSMYNALGLLSKGHVVEVSRADLIGKFIGQTAPKTKEMIEKARGGILFVDEAYALARSENDTEDFGHESIEIIMKEMSDGPGDIAVMVAGYPAEMQTFLNSNPGLRSRFNQFFNFEDYMPSELLQIADVAAIKEEVVFADEAKKLLEAYVTRQYRNRDRYFGNARMIYGIVDTAKKKMGIRLSKSPDLEKLTKEELSTISLEDMEAVLPKQRTQKLTLKIDHAMLDESLLQLSSLIGLTAIKKEISDMVLLVKYYNESGDDALGKFSLHATLSGNPGTGKTTLARILANVYNALGLLEKGQLVEVDRDDLVAGYVGQTAIKTEKKIEEAMGGVLFIDEAYSLTMGGSESDFGKEAIATILKQMEDRRNEFAVIAAGYPKKMDQFMQSNPGLQSRFDRHYHLPDYEAPELMQIVQAFIQQDDLTMSPEAAEKMLGLLEKACQKKDSSFGNARFARQCADEMIKNQNLRMATMTPEQRNAAGKQLILPQDLGTITLPETGSSPIGFRK